MLSSFSGFRVSILLARVCLILALSLFLLQFIENLQISYRRYGFHFRSMHHFVYLFIYSDKDDSFLIYNVLQCSPSIKQQLGFEVWYSLSQSSLFQSKNYREVYSHSVDFDKSKREKMLLIFLY